MTTHYHAVVWLDHSEARIIHFDRDEADIETVRPEHAPRRIHRRSGSRSGSHVHDDPEFYRDVAEACESAKVLLVTGPSMAKTEFATYLREHAPKTAERVAGVEALEQVTDGELLAEARRFFAAHDRTTPQMS